MLIVVLKNEKLKWFKIWNFRKIAKFTCREICAHENRDLNMSRKLHVTRYFKTSLNCQEKSNYSICPLNKVPEINCSWGYCSGHVVRKLKRKNKERKWCYLECDWIGFSALMISDVSFSVWVTAWRQAPLEIWNLGMVLYFPLSPSIPTKTRPASMCHKWTQQVHLFFSFFWSGLLFNETIVPSSGERRKKRLPKMVKNILKIESGKTWTAFHLLKGLKATFTWMIG